MKEPLLNIENLTVSFDMYDRGFVKKRLDEITKVNLYDIGLSEEELKRRKNKNMKKIKIDVDKEKR